MAHAVEALHRYIGELFESSPAAQVAEAAGVLPRRSEMRAEWDRVIGMVFAEAGLTVPEGVFMQTGGRAGLHGEDLGHMLAEMQSVARAHPGAVW